MLLVKTYLNKSKIHGIGLYAGQFIPKGKAIYRCSPGLDINLSKKQFNKLDYYSRKQIKHYGHLSQKIVNGIWPLMIPVSVIIVKMAILQ